MTVLHDGRVPYPGVVECLTKLKGEEKRLILLSNSSKRKAVSSKGLNKG
jgi:ribonucleotide monophosphatase NagD (HAD superfamily)